MLTRRWFIAVSSAAAACAAAPSELHAASTRSGLEFGVQLYTVRNDIQDLGATLRLIHSIGYVSVETFPPIYNRPAKELKALINGIGLKAPSGHFDYPTLEEKIDYAAELGLEYMICPMIPPAMWGSLDGFHRAAEHLNQIAAKAQAAGLKFGYHPHNYEYKPLDGGRGFDVLMRDFDPSIKLELDIYWAVEGGQDPIALMRQNRQRLALIHIKDRKPVQGVTYNPLKASAHNFTEAGSGTIDRKAVLGEARKIGVTQFYVDQDGSDLPIEQSLRVNWNYLSHLAI
ncbi:MAG TPA: TIM barrel protein [Mycobacteriales bacterium]|nr:TIM barrel protein [Mycobacteriales bacterium]